MLARLLELARERGPDGRRIGESAEASATSSPASTSTPRPCGSWATGASRSSPAGQASPEHSVLKLFGSEIDAARRARRHRGPGGRRARRRLRGLRLRRQLRAAALDEAATCRPTGPRSRRGRPRSSATSSRSACSACPGAERTRGEPAMQMNDMILVSGGTDERARAGLLHRPRGPPGSGALLRRAARARAGLARAAQGCVHALAASRRSSRSTRITNASRRSSGRSVRW